MANPKTLTDADENLWKLSQEIAQREDLPHWKWIMIAIADSIIDAGSASQKKTANKSKEKLME